MLIRQQQEIREIDGDMKTLVYENYSKFISATDTIRKVKCTCMTNRRELTGIWSVDEVECREHGIRNEQTERKHLEYIQAE